jgi:hypothetical protein
MNNTKKISIILFLFLFQITFIKTGEDELQKTAKSIVKLRNIYNVYRDRNNELLTWMENSIKNIEPEYKDLLFFFPYRKIYNVDNLKYQAKQEIETFIDQRSKLIGSVILFYTFEIKLKSRSLDWYKKRIENIMPPFFPQIHTSSNESKNPISKQKLLPLLNQKRLEHNIKENTTGMSLLITILTVLPQIFETKTINQIFDTYGEKVGVTFLTQYLRQS